MHVYRFPHVPDSGKLQKALAMAGETHSYHDVVVAVDSGAAQCWLNDTDDSVVVTEIKETPNHRVLNFWLAAGNIESVLEMHERILEKFGRRMSCTLATATGRKGWERKLPDWETAATVYIRRLDDGEGRRQ